MNLKSALFLFLSILPIDSVFADKLQVFVSVLPQQYFVKQVGGERIDVEALVLPGQSPATYNPTTKQIQRLASARLFFRTGVPYEDAWLKRIQSTNPKMIIVDARDNIPLLEMHGHDDHHHGDNSDPHIWTSPANVIIQTEQIRDQLSLIDPAGKNYYTENARVFIHQLQELDDAIRAKLAPLKQRSFMVFHPSWGYFAGHYGLEQISVEKEGKEPGARSISRLIEEAREEQIKVIFIQPQFSQRIAQTIAHAIDGRVVVIDPLAENYLENLQFVSDQLIEHLQ